MAVTSGTLGSVSNGPAVPITEGKFVIELFGTFSATARLERRGDGTNWVPLYYYNAIWSRTTPSVEILEEAASAQYRVACTAWTSGTITWQISQD